VTDASESESTWARLTRRKVAQWGIAYAAGAWGFLQGLAYVSSLLSWPAQLQRLTGLALLIGLPIVLVLAWYHGDRGHRHVTRTELTVLTLLFLLGGGLFWRYQHAGDTTTVAAPPSPSMPAAVAADDQSIAVLPFVNMSSDKEQEYFSDGLSEELLNLLAQVPQLRVIARTSSFSFKGKEVDVATIAKTLNVANVLEGSVRKSGDTIRITAQLIRAADSSHLWSRTYDRQMTDVFKVQDEIAAAVVDELKIKLLKVAPKRPVTDPQAYAFFLQGREVMRQFNPEAIEQAIALYKQALSIDPTYAPAWDGLADGYYNEVDLGVASVDQALPLAREAIDKALGNDPGYAPAYARAALIEGAIEGDLAAAARHLEQGLALDPANLDLIGVAIKIARRLGRPQQTLDFAEYVVERDPVNVYGHEQVAISYNYAGRFDEALAAYRTGLKLNPGSAAQHSQIGDVLIAKGDAKAALSEYQQEPVESFRLLGLSAAYHALGRKAESDAALDVVIRKYERTMPTNIAWVFAFRGEGDRTFEWLNKAVEYRDIALGTIPFDPWWRIMHSDPRWLPLLRRMGKAPDQLAVIKFDVTVPK
jgi:TolB-like protein/tetratricopeptide (TPR) repeat protein